MMNTEVSWDSLGVLAAPPMDVFLAVHRTCRHISCPNYGA